MWICIMDAPAKPAKWLLYNPHPHGTVLAHALLSLGWMYEPHSRRLLPILFSAHRPIVCSAHHALASILDIGHVLCKAAVMVAAACTGHGCCRQQHQQGCLHDNSVLNNSCSKKLLLLEQPANISCSREVRSGEIRTPKIIEVGWSAYACTICAHTAWTPPHSAQNRPTWNT